jgi:hypothetical protein
MAGHVAMPRTAVTDIADAGLRWLVRRDWEGIEGVAVHGPEDLSYHQAAAVMERTLERPVRYLEASANQYVRALVAAGANAGYALSVVEMFSELARGITRAEPRTVESTTPTTLAAWTRSELLTAEGIDPLDRCAIGAEMDQVRTIFITHPECPVRQRGSAIPRSRCQQNP